MNIVVTSQYFPTSKLPGGMPVLELAHALQRYGHRVTYVCLQQRHPGTSPTGFEISQHCRCELPIVRVRYPIIRGASYLPCLTGLMRGLRIAAPFGVPEVIHAQFTMPVGVAAVFAGMLRRVPVVVTERSGPIQQFCASWKTRWPMRFSLQRAAAVTAVSRHLADEMKGALGLKRGIDVVPNLFDPHKFALSSNRESAPAGPRILFVGRGGDWCKGNDLMVKAFARALLRLERNARLIIVGPGLQEELLPLAKNLGVSQSCRFTGGLSIDALAEEMRACDFVVVPSRYETFCVVVIEAMASGKPVVATRCGGPSETVVPETGLLVANEDEPALTNAIIEMAETRSSYQAAAIARRAANIYSDSAVATRYTEIYERIRKR